jgi:hypothetical protein
VVGCGSAGALVRGSLIGSDPFFPRGQWVPARTVPVPLAPAREGPYRAGSRRTLVPKKGA